MELSLKEEYAVNWIPGINRLLDREKEHYEYLCQFDAKDYPMVELFKERSKASMEMLNQRLAEYIQHYETL